MPFWRNRRLAHNQSTLGDPNIAASRSKEEYKENSEGSLRRRAELSISSQDCIRTPIRDLPPSSVRPTIEAVIGCISDLKCKQVYEFSRRNWSLGPPPSGELRQLGGTA